MVSLVLSVVAFSISVASILLAIVAYTTMGTTCVANSEHITGTGDGGPSMPIALVRSEVPEYIERVNVVPFWDHEMTVRSRFIRMGDARYIQLSTDSLYLSYNTSKSYPGSISFDLGVFGIEAHDFPVWHGEHLIPCILRIGGNATLGRGSIRFWLNDFTLSQYWLDSNNGLQSVWGFRTSYVGNKTFEYETVLHSWTATPRTL